MTLKILVAYATKKGSTREVADVIAAELRERRADVTVVAAADVTDVASYDGVVVGGSLYTGRWHSDARRLLERQWPQVSPPSLAVFGIGPLTSEPDDLAAARRQLDHTLDKLADVHAVTVAVFGGVIDPRKLPFPLSHLRGSDARDWDQIRNWARTVAATFAAVRTTVQA